MRLTGLGCVVGLVGMLSACGADSGVAPTSPSSPNVGALAAGRGGGGGGGGGAGQNQDISIEFDGNIVTAGPQPAVIDRDTKSRLKILAGSDNIASALSDEFQLSVAAGSPAYGALGDCVFNPSDAAPADVQRVIDRLDDAPQERGRVTIEIDKYNLNGEGGHYLYHNWEDSDGVRYRTWFKRSDLLPDLLPTVTNPEDNVYEFTGGSIVSWDTATVAVACPFNGLITLTVIP